MNSWDGTTPTRSRGTPVGSTPAGLGQECVEDLGAGRVGIDAIAKCWGQNLVAHGYCRQVDEFLGINAVLEFYALLHRLMCI